MRCVKARRRWQQEQRGRGAVNDGETTRSTQRDVTHDEFPRLLMIQRCPVDDFVPSRDESVLGRLECVENGRVRRDAAVVPHHRDREPVGDPRAVHDVLPPGQLEQRRLDSPRLVLQHRPAEQREVPRGRRDGPQRTCNPTTKAITDSDATSPALCSYLGSRPFRHVNRATQHVASARPIPSGRTAPCTPQEFAGKRWRKKKKETDAG